MNSFRFASPLALLLLILPLALYIQPALARYRPELPPLLRYSDVRLMHGLPSNWRVRWRGLPDILRWVAWGLLVIALARPQSGLGQEILRGGGVDIVLALDISNSMAALDFPPLNRLQTAKAVMGEFIAGRQFDRMGLVVFARDAFQQCPLTLDYDVLRQLLDEVQLVKDITDDSGNPLLLDGTSVGLGIASAANLLRQGTAASKVIILLTDGDNNAALDPLVAASAAAALGIRVYAVGIGRNGMVEIPDQNGLLIPFESQLNDAALAEIAAVGNGRYFRAEDSAGLARVYEEINLLEQSDIERRVITRWQDQMIFLLMPGVFLLVAERLLRSTVFQTLP